MGFNTFLYTSDAFSRLVDLDLCILRVKLEVREGVVVAELSGEGGEWEEETERW